VEQVDPEGAAAQAGIQTGDVILQVNRQPVTSTDDVRRALQSSGDRPPLLLINRGGQTIFVPAYSNRTMSLNDGEPGVQGESPFFFS
jgi:serine protease Do